MHTETNTDLSTITNTATKYSTTTVTTTPTTTVPAPAGFTPIALASGYVPRKLRLAKRAPCQKCKACTCNPYMPECNPHMQEKDPAEKKGKKPQKREEKRGLKEQKHKGKKGVRQECAIKLGPKNATNPYHEPDVYPQKVECLQLVKIVHIKNVRPPTCKKRARTFTLEPATIIEHTTRTAVATSVVTEADATVTADETSTMTITVTSIVEEMITTTDIGTSFSGLLYVTY
ncbi:hypothetical protein IL306_012747 [Fusarium sp. DS 682]|nr:hypothetical protein IL306_012747 [Fusarium sp. DS 682]